MRNKNKLTEERMLADQVSSSTNYTDTISKEGGITDSDIEFIKEESSLFFPLILMNPSKRSGIILFVLAFLLGSGSILIFSCLDIRGLNVKVFLYGFFLACVEIAAYLAGDVTQRYSYLIWLPVWFYSMAYAIKVTSVNNRRVQERAA